MLEVGGRCGLAAVVSPYPWPSTTPWATPLGSAAGTSEVMMKPEHMPSSCQSVKGRLPS